ncbi:MAG TPA: universal stress protein [Acidimicrobiales bacterium]|nr:universal stress protein [Acidimicrobiales bacterium]
MIATNQHTQPATSGSGRVVVGIDDSDNARQALRCALEVARRWDWHLTVVQAWHLTYPAVPYGMVPPDVSVAVGEAAEESLRRIAKEVLGDSPDVSVTLRAREGFASAILVEESLGAELLVVGSRGRGGFASLTLGSVSSACVHHARCPVLVIRPHD